MATATPAIEFSGVNKVYQRRFGGVQVAALSNISFAVARGEVCAFLGPNGAGKTTSMNILMGFIYASSGLSRVFGYEPGDVRAKERIGFLPENFAFYRYLNAEKLLQFHLRLSGRQTSDPAALISGESAFASNVGAGSALRSTLPFGVSGSVSSRTNALGIMWAGRTATSASRSSFEVRGSGVRK